jgi:uncharacterized protein (TIGR02145 family)
MKKILFSIVCFALTIFIAKAQNDTMYVMKNGVVTNKQSVKPSDVDSIIFYMPQTSTFKTVTDADSNVYNTVTIGTQTWISENLKTTKYNDGTVIPNVSESTEWSSLSSPGYCWYNNDQTSYGNTYGGLYNWYVVETGNLCPTGWHVPTDVEWTTLTDYLGGLSVAGGKLKESGTTHWIDPNTGATNESGFTALPGGHRSHQGTFNNIGGHGGWWSSSKDGPSKAYGRVLQNNTEKVIDGSYDNGFRGGWSIRCLRD